MSDPGCAPEHRDPSRGLADAPTGQAIAHATALGQRLDELAAGIGAQLDELRERVDTALRALRLVHDDDAGARRRLRALREGASYEEAFTAPHPLVSVVIPTWDRPDTLIERAVASALNQTHRNLEVIVVGDASPPSTAAAVGELADPRVSFHNLTIRGPYDSRPDRAWMASGTPAFNAGVALARGLWIAPLGDDDAFVPDHVERLLSVARTRHLELVYGRIRYTFPDGSTGVIGQFPPRPEQFGMQATLYHHGLDFIELELGHALFDTPNDWGFIERMMRVGVRMAMVEEISVDYWPSMRGISTLEEQRPTAEPAPSAQRLDDLTAQVSELESRLSSEHQRATELETKAIDLEHRLSGLHKSRSWRLTSPLRRLRARL